MYYFFRRSFKPCISICGRRCPASYQNKSWNQDVEENFFSHMCSFPKSTKIQCFCNTIGRTTYLDDFWRIYAIYMIQLCFDDTMNFIATSFKYFPDIVVEGSILLPRTISESPIDDLLDPWAISVSTGSTGSEFRSNP